MLQARLSKDDDRLYHVDRDIAHNFGKVAGIVAGRLENEVWPVLVGILKEKGVSMDDLGEACAAFCRFVGTPPRKGETMQSSLEDAGWWKVKEEAQVALCATMGTVIMGYYWCGVRDATMGGKGPTDLLGELAKRGEEAAKLIATPWWRRRLDAVGRWFAGIWSALRGRKAD